MSEASPVIVCFAIFGGGLLTGIGIANEIHGANLRKYNERFRAYIATGLSAKQILDIESGQGEQK